LTGAQGCPPLTVFDRRQKEDPMPASPPNTSMSDLSRAVARGGLPLGLQWRGALQSQVQTGLRGHAEQRSHRPPISARR